MKITKTRLRQLIREELQVVIEKVKYAEISPEEEKYEQFGNCGMVAIAMAQEAISRGMKNVLMVLVHDEGENPLVVEDPRWPPNLYHVAVSIDGKYYDDRSIDKGAVSRDQITVVGGEDLREYEDIEISEFKLNSQVKSAIEKGTAADKCPLDFKERAIVILDKIKA